MHASGNRPFPSARRVPLPRWLKIDNLEDLKRHLVSIIIAVLAVLFLREAVERAKDLDLLRLAVALAIMIAALVLFLSLREHRKNDSSGGDQA